VSIQSREHIYRLDGVEYQASISWDDSRSGPRPAVLVAHAWRGRSDFENGEAMRLANAGYVGFALDLYGKGVLGRSPEENRRLMQPLVEDRGILQQRMLLAVDEARALDEVDGSRMAAIGFCFGGLCVLDLARCGAGLRAVVSLHGLLTPPALPTKHRFSGKVLVLHGWDDPLALPEQVVALGGELTALGADWQIHAYGNTVHAFTNPAANDATHGLKYDATADARARRSLAAVLQEAFS
jgi:dienelactone hydrolase